MRRRIGIVFPRQHDRQRIGGERNLGTAGFVRERDGPLGDVERGLKSLREVDVPVQASASCATRTQAENQRVGVEHAVLHDGGNLERIGFDARCAKVVGGGVAAEAKRAADRDGCREGRCPSRRRAFPRCLRVRATSNTSASESPPHAHLHVHRRSGERVDRPQAPVAAEQRQRLGVHVHFFGIDLAARRQVDRADRPIPPCTSRPESEPLRLSCKGTTVPLSVALPAIEPRSSDARSRAAGRSG